MAATFIICRTASKLKHLSLQQIYYQLINMCLIFHTLAGINVAVINIVDVH